MATHLKDKTRSSIARHGLFLALTLGSMRAAFATPRPKSLVLVGGALDDANAEIYEMIIARAGGPNAVLCIVSTAADDPCCDADSSAVFYESMFSHYGSKSLLYLNVTTEFRTNAFENETIISQINTCDGFWFGGGDQTRIMSSFYDNDVDESTGVDTRTPSPALEAILDRFATNGGVIAGTSAGTDAQSGKVMATDGDAFFGLVYGTAPFDYSAHAPPVTNDSLVTYDPNGGLGFFPYGQVDTHFGERGRQGRMIRLLADTQSLPGGTSRGFGIDQNTALVIPLDDLDPSIPRDMGRIYGQAGVTICDTQNAIVDYTASSFCIENVRCSYATAGDTINLLTGDITVQSDKHPLVGREIKFDPYVSSDVFNSPGKAAMSVDREFVLQASSLFNSTQDASVGRSYESNPVSFGVRMTKDDLSAGFQGLFPFNGTLLSYTSYVGLKVDIYAL